MTAEVAILNRSGVALAADSAVTLQVPGGPKIYQTRKLFTLSKFDPVGVMVYGSADFMGVPWETLIKRYRAQLGKAAFPTIEKYSLDFLSYIEKQRAFFPAVAQENVCYRLARHRLRLLKTHLRKGLEQTPKGKPSKNRLLSNCFVFY
jgi:hypothetical protein